MADNDWLKDLKVGDEVAVAYHGFSTHYEFRNVERINTRFIVVSGKNYRKESGSQPGYGSSIRAATPELKAEIAAQNRRRFVERALDNMKWSRLTDEQIEAVFAALPEKNDTEGN